MDDVDLTRRLQDARPPLPRRGEPLSPDAVDTLRRIVDSTPRTAVSTRSKTPVYFALVAAVAVILTVALTVVVSIQPSPGYAVATPPVAAADADRWHIARAAHGTEHATRARPELPDDRIPVLGGSAWSSTKTARSGRSP